VTLGEGSGCAVFRDNIGFRIGLIHQIGHLISLQPYSSKFFSNVFKPLFSLSVKGTENRITNNKKIIITGRVPEPVQDNIRITRREGPE
jgi:hypothetical protein